MRHSLIAAVTAAFWCRADAAYDMWSAIDDMMAICPAMPAPNPLPEGMKAGQWPTQKGYDLSLDVQNGVSGMKNTVPHILTFIRSGKNAAVTITYELIDANGEVIFPETSQLLQASGSVVSIAEKCKCTGNNGRVGQVPEMIKKYGADYGKSCKAWDSVNCATWYPNNVGAGCCKQWCYVGAECPDAYMAEVNYGAYWSYTGACSGPATSPCPFTAAAKVDPCKCVNVDAAKQWSAANVTTFGAAYGASCKAWDEKNCNDPTIYGPQFLDTWCCENWCWVSNMCKTALPSKVWPGLTWTTAECPDDPKKTAQCPFKAQVTTPVKGNPYCACLGWSPDVLKSNYGRRRTRSVADQYPAGYGATCSAWDRLKCDKFFPTMSHDIWCCQNWCYVDEDCPTANPSSIASGYFWSVAACDDYGPHLRDCSYTGVCKDNATNTGITPSMFIGIVINTTYGVGCKAHDEMWCKGTVLGNWGNYPEYWGNAPHAAGAHNWCCQSWSYVEEACPGSEEGMAGLAYSYKTCEGKMKDGSTGFTDNWRVWNEATNLCEAGVTTTVKATTYVTTTVASGGRRMLNGDEPAGAAEFLARSLKEDEAVAGAGEEPKPVAGEAPPEKEEDNKAIYWSEGHRFGFNYLLHKGNMCGGRAYTDSEALGCEAWSGLTMDQCQDKCSSNAQAPHCPKRTCGAASFFPSTRAKDSVGRCHLYAASECKSVLAAAANSLVKVDKKIDILELDDEEDGVAAENEEDDEDADSEDEGHNEDEDDEEGDAEARELAPSRRRASRSYPSGRRRSPPAAPVARRRQPTRVSAAGRRRGPVGGNSASTPSARRRQAPASSPAAAARRRQPAPPPSPSTDGGRRRQASSGPSPGPPADTGRRRQNAASVASPPAPPATSRRRAVGVGGRAYSTGRRRAPAADERRRRSRRRAGPAEERRRRSRRRADERRRKEESRRRQPYGYSNTQVLSNNYGGNSPQKSSYGYSGKAQKKGSKHTVMMAAAAVGAGVVLGVGGYYAYTRYSQSVGRGERGVGYQSTQWCRVPAGHPNAGGMIECPDCYRVYGSGCTNQDACFNGGGCSYDLPDDTVRDDLMGEGFTPSNYRSPLTLQIKHIAGIEFEAKDICPVNNSVAGQSESNWIKASSFKTNLFVTFTEMEVLGDSGGDDQGYVSRRRAAICIKDTRGSCPSGSNSACYSHEVCASGWCQCEAGYCYSSQSYACKRQGSVNAATFQADISWAPIVALLVSLRALRLF